MNNSPLASPLFPLILWDTLRTAGVAFAFLAAALIFSRPDIWLRVFWSIVVPLLPLLFFIAPGIWRNICPIATLNALPRRLEFKRESLHVPHLQEYSYVASVVLLLVLVSNRKWLFDQNGAATALLILSGMTLAFISGILFKGKSGWCNGFCPIYPVEILYGQTPFIPIANTHCHPCIGCTKNCYDLNPSFSHLTDRHRGSPFYTASQRFFAGIFPGFVMAFFNTPFNSVKMDAPVQFAFYCLVSLAYCTISLVSFRIFDVVLKMPPNRMPALYGAAAFNIYYWFSSVSLPANLSAVTGQWPVPDFVPWAIRLPLFFLTFVWLLRRTRKN